MTANVIDRLAARGMLDDVTSPELRQAVEEPLAVYAGFDPSSDSLQVGNLVTIMALAHFQRAGHRVIALAGGATGLIGDPSGKSAERVLLTSEDVERNLAGIRENLGRFLDFDGPSASAALVNNADWLGRFGFVEFLRDVGKHFRVGAMLGKESVRARLESEAGMSYTEFSYQLLQAYDFLHLYDAMACRLQIGGSDQWGNITAGIDLIRRQRGAEVFGLTIPLVTDSAGQKVGKSAGNAIYLSADRTPVYTFYQFFIRVPDDEVVKLLKVFTFLPLDEIDALAAQVRESPEERAAQKTLAREVTRLVHGEEALAIAERSTAVLFGASMQGLHADDLLAVFADVPSRELPREQVEDVPLPDLAVAAGLCGSKGQARRLIEGGGLYLNNRRVGGVDERVPGAAIVDGKLLVLRSGKKTFHLVQIV